MNKRLLKKIALSLMSLLIAACTTTGTSNRPSTMNGSYSTNTASGDSREMMKMLQKNSSHKLAELETATVDNYFDAWYKLALIAKRNNRNDRQFSSDLLTWQANHPGHPGNDLLPSQERLRELLNWQAPRQIAVLLPESGPYAAPAKKIRQGIMNAYYKNIRNAGRQHIKFYDTTAQDVTDLYQQALNEGADFVIGPLTKDAVNKLSNSRINTPVIALNYAEPHRFTSFPSKLYQFGILPEDETSQLAHTARNSGKSHALIITSDSPWGKRMTDSFSKNWKDAGGTITDTWYYKPSTVFSSDIAKLLNVDPATDKQLTESNHHADVLTSQRRNDFDIVFIFASPQKARVILPLLHYYYAGDVPVFASSSILGQQPNPTRDADFNGVTVCHIPALTRTHQHNTAIATDSLYSLGQDAYLISQSLNRVIEMPDLPLYGSTGALTLAEQQQIRRKLPCHAIQNGHIQSS